MQQTLSEWVSLYANVNQNNMSSKATVGQLESVRGRGKGVVHTLCSITNIPTSHHMWEQAIGHRLQLLCNGESIWNTLCTRVKPLPQAKFLRHLQEPSVVVILSQHRSEEVTRTIYHKAETVTTCWYFALSVDLRPQHVKHMAWDSPANTQLLFLKLPAIQANNGHTKDWLNMYMQAHRLER